jgi:hypothetical protein
MTTNFVPSQGGGLATSRYDFQAHINGTNFRHTADQINVLNPSLVYGGATNVEQALEDLNGLSTIISNTGAGFIVVPDGYNAYHAANGTNNLDPTIPTLDTFLNPLFALITAGSPLPANYSRLQHGGVVLIKSGTYMVLNTIQVPVGITLLGEGAGTRIVNISQIVLPPTSATAPTPLTPFSISGATNASPIIVSVSAPTSLATGQTVIINGVSGNTAANNSPINPFWTITAIDSQHFSLNGSTGSGAYTSGGLVYCTRPIFNVLSDTNRVAGGYADDIAISGANPPFMFSRQTVIMNMIVSDNFVEPPLLGDTNYKLPQNFTSSLLTTPALITQQQGSNLLVENVSASGRITFSSGTVVSKATSSFINSSSPSLPSGAVLGTYLSVSKCMVDGFSIPFVFAGLGGKLDHFLLTNSRVGAYGYYAGDGVDFANNTFINTSDTNMIISGNDLRGNANNMTTVVELSQLGSGPPAVQARSKVVFGANNVSIGASAAFAAQNNGSFTFFLADPTLLSTFASYVNIAGRPITITNAASPYTIDSVSNAPPYDTAIVLVDSSTGAITVAIPSTAFDGFKIIIKDIGGMASINPITISVGGGQSIDGVSGSLTYRTNYGAITLVSQSENWWSI